MILSREPSWSRVEVDAKQKLKIIGFTDLGDETPITRADKEEDYALVQLFQPFRRLYIHTTCCYIFTERSNYTHFINSAFRSLYVNAVVTEGANWNRGVWKLNGVNNNNPS